MKEWMTRVNSLIQNMKLSHKLGLLTAILFLGSYSCFVFFSSTSKESLIPLLSKGEKFSLEDRLKVRAYLDEHALGWEENEKGELLVPKKQASKISEIVSSLNFLKESKKGYELFDQKGWMKGEKEISLLEQRALKGQLEKELMSFKQVLQAHVLFSSSQTLWSQPAEKKASVIIQLRPGHRMTATLLEAIASHVASGLPGLAPQTIAISDTEGRLYQSHEGVISLEESIEPPLNDFLEVLTGLFNQWLGKEHYTFNLHLNELTNEISVVLLVKGKQEALPESFHAYLEQLSHSFGFKLQLQIFSSLPPEKKMEIPFLKIVAGFLILLLGVGVFLSRILKKKKREQIQRHFAETREPSSPWLSKFLHEMPMDVLSRSMKEEDPQTLATLLSHLDPKKAEVLLTTFSDGTQEAVLWHLERMERGDA